MTFKAPVRKGNGIIIAVTLLYLLSSCATAVNDRPFRTSMKDIKVRTILLGDLQLSPESGDFSPVLSQKRLYATTSKLWEKKREKIRHDLETRLSVKSASVKSGADLIRSSRKVGTFKDISYYTLDHTKIRGLLMKSQADLLVVPVLEISRFHEDYYETDLLYCSNRTWGYAEFYYLAFDREGALVMDSQDFGNLKQNNYQVRRHIRNRFMSNFHTNRDMQRGVEDLFKLETMGRRCRVVPDEEGLETRLENGLNWLPFQYLDYFIKNED